ncbi:MAG: glycosyltransferase family 2 protein [Acutalibacteraceae bacterium]
MVKHILFSVVMPVYNVESHIKKAVESVLAQTFNDFEIILVDDASPDGCSAICEKYAQQYDNIKCVHHEKNLGLSAARNTGLSYVSGEYVTFMDSDDYIDPDLFERVKASLDENNADCVVFGVREEYFNKEDRLSKVYELKYGSEERISSREEVRRTVIKLEEKTFLGYAWNKFYKTDRIREKKLKFEKVTLIEDIVFNVHFFEDVKSLNILNIAPYHYMKRIDGSLTNKFVTDYYTLHRRRVEMIFEMYHGWDMCTDSVKTTLGNIYARYIFSALQRNCDKRSGMDGKSRRAFLKSVFEDEMFKELSPFISADGYAGILYRCLKKQKTWFCLLFGRLIYIVKEKMPVIFAGAKQMR